MKATKENYYKLCKCMYEATNDAYWINKPACEIDTNFFVNFWDVYNQLKAFVKSGGVFKYNLVKLNGAKVPFTYNSLNM